MNDRIAQALTKFFDMGDNVRVNKPKLGAALKKIPCLESKKD